MAKAWLVLTFLAALWHTASGQAYTGNLTCEKPLRDITQANGTTTFVFNQIVVGTQIITTEQQITIFKYNTSEIILLWNYFNQDLVTTDPTATATKHDNSTAAHWCSKSQSLGALKAALETIVIGCDYKPHANGTHIFTALYRIETECTQNAASRHCTTPKNFFGPSYYKAVSVSSEIMLDPGTRQVTTVLTEVAYPFTWGTAEMVQRACPKTCSNVATCEALDDLTTEDCCNVVLFEIAAKYLSVGLEENCTWYADLEDKAEVTCQHEAKSTAELVFVNGGLVTMRSGAGIEVPASSYDTAACASPCTFLVEPVHPTLQTRMVTAIKTANPTWINTKMAGQAQTLQPSGMTFTSPVKVCLKMLDSSIPASTVHVHKMDFDGNIIGDEFGTLTVGTTSWPVEVDPTKMLICFYTLSFSTYGAISYNELEANVDTTPGPTSPPGPPPTIIVSNDDDDINWWVVGFTIGGVVALLLCALLGYMLRQGRQQRPQGYTQQPSKTASDPGPVVYRSSSPQAMQPASPVPQSPLQSVQPPNLYGSYMNDPMANFGMAPVPSMGSIPNSYAATPYRGFSTPYQGGERNL